MFVENGDNDYNNLIEDLDRMTVNKLRNMDVLNMSNDFVHTFFFPIYSPFLKDTILLGQHYDSYLKEWLDSYYKWKLLYRASEHDYTATSFHECCDNKGSTLIVIKSSGGWIFGVYTTETWSGYGIY